MGPGCWVAGAGCVRSVVLWPLWGGVLVSGAWGFLHCGRCRCAVLSVVRFVSRLCRRLWGVFSALAFGWVVWLVRVPRSDKVDVERRPSQANSPEYV